MGLAFGHFCPRTAASKCHSRNSASNSTAQLNIRSYVRQCAGGANGNVIRIVGNGASTTRLNNEVIELRQNSAANGSRSPKVSKPWLKDEGAVSKSDTGEHGLPIVDDSYRQNLFLTSAS